MGNHYDSCRAWEKSEEGKRARQSPTKRLTFHERMLLWEEVSKRLEKCDDNVRSPKEPGHHQS